MSHSAAAAAVTVTRSTRRRRRRPAVLSTEQTGSQRSGQRILTSVGALTLKAGARVPLVTQSFAVIVYGTVVVGVPYVRQTTADRRFHYRDGRRSWWRINATSFRAVVRRHGRSVRHRHSHDRTAVGRRVLVGNVSGTTSDWDDDKRVPS